MFTILGSQSPVLERMAYDDQLKSQGCESLLVLRNDDHFDSRLITPVGILVRVPDHSSN